MIRMDAFWLMIAIASALGVVAAQHQSRKTFMALETEHTRSQNLEVEWRQLQLEQSTWAAHSRIEKIARSRLGLHKPEPGQMLIIGAQP